MTFTTSRLLALCACIVFVLVAFAVPLLPGIQLLALGLAFLAAAALVP